VDGRTARPARKLTRRAWICYRLMLRRTPGPEPRIVRYGGSPAILIQPIMRKSRTFVPRRLTMTDEVRSCA